MLFRVTYRRLEKVLLSMHQSLSFSGAADTSRHFKKEFYPATRNSNPSRSRRNSAGCHQSSPRVANRLRITATARSMQPCRRSSLKSTGMPAAMLSSATLPCIASTAPTPACASWGAKASRLSPVPSLTPAAPRTVRLHEALRDLALAFGGAAGACLRARSALPTSADTLLRRAHAAALPVLPTPRVLGSDDVSFRKGQVFGTILTDGERHKVVDLLPDRIAETAAVWLQKHPGVEMVTRDRSADDRRAISTGAPHAVPVADRVHLAKNAGEARERVVQRNHQALRLAAKAIDEARVQQTAPPTEEVQPPPPPRPLLLPSMETSPTQRSPAQQRRLAHDEESMALTAQGLGPKTIGQRVGLTRQTVAGWLRAGSFPARPPSTPRRMRITPYAP